MGFANAQPILHATAPDDANRVNEVKGEGMELGLHPGIIFALAIGLFLALHLALRWPLPLAFLAVAAVTALLGDFGIPFRHLVEGGFGFINLVLALFAGAFFGHMMRASGAADAAAAGIVGAVGGRVLPVLALADGVNMPWSNVSRALLALALPFAAAALVWFAWGCGPSKTRAGAR